MTTADPTGAAPPPPTDALKLLPKNLADDNLVAVKRDMDAGNLDQLRGALTAPQFAAFETAVNNGDIDAARAAVAGVDVPGVGVLSPAPRPAWLIPAVIAAVVVAGGLIAALVLSGGDDLKTIPETLSDDADFSTVSELIDTAGLSPLLSETGPYTMFAPTNEAFEAMADAERTVLLEDGAKLEAVLRYHVVVGQELAADDLSGEIPTLEGQSVVATGSGGSLKINEALVTKPDIEASNGVIHGIDKVLIPPGLDLTAPPSDDIMELLAADPDYSTLTSLLTSTGLSSTLTTAGPFTLFAPDNDAFDAVPDEQLATLQTDETLLRSVLNYHVVAGDYPSSSLETGQLDSVEGSPLDIVVNGAAVTVDGANVVAADRLASNGVVHGIDQVLVPPGVDLSQPTTTTEATTTTTTEAVATTTSAPTTTLASTTTVGASTE